MFIIGPFKTVLRSIILPGNIIPSWGKIGLNIWFNFTTIEIIKQHRNKASTIYRVYKIYYISMS
jgi:hypothetical protein